MTTDALRFAWLVAGGTFQRPYGEELACMPMDRLEQIMPPVPDGDAAMQTMVTGLLQIALRDWTIERQARMSPDLPTGVRVKAPNSTVQWAAYGPADELDALSQRLLYALADRLLTVQGK